MKLLQKLITLLIATIILNINRHESTCGGSLTSSTVAIRRSGDVGYELQRPRADNTHCNGDEDDPKHQHSTGAEIAMEAVPTAAARRRLAALTPTDQANLQPMISAGKHDQEIAALLNTLDNLDGQDATSMMIVTVQTDGHDVCNSSVGTHLLTKAYKNKVDYCNLHDCTVRYLLENWPMAVTSPPDILLHVMDAHPSAAHSWLLWMPPHSLFTNLSSSFLLHTYSSLDKHFVLLPSSTSSSSPPSFLESKMEKSDLMDPLIFLVRNSNWSREFLAQWRARVIAMEATTRSTFKKPREVLETPQNEHDEHNKDEINDNGNVHGVAAALLEVLKTRSESVVFDGIQEGKVYLENGLYLHGHQESLVKSYDKLNAIGNAALNTGSTGDYQDKRHTFIKRIQSRSATSSKAPISWPFLVHFEGCNLCNAPSQDDIPELCLSTFQQAFYYADNQLLGLSGMQHHRLYSTVV